MDVDLETVPVDIDSMDLQLGPCKCLHQESELDTIRDACSDYGKVSNVHLNLDRRTGFVKGYALVEFCEMSEAEKAIESLNGSMLLGKQIRVDWAFAGPGGVDVCVAQSARKKAKIEVS